MKDNLHRVKELLILVNPIFSFVNSLHPSEAFGASFNIKQETCGSSLITSHLLRSPLPYQFYVSDLNLLHDQAFLKASKAIS